jgi:hypothetical protein
VRYVKSSVSFLSSILDLAIPKLKVELQDDKGLSCLWLAFVPISRGLTSWICRDLPHGLQCTINCDASRLSKSVLSRAYC